MAVTDDFKKAIATGDVKSVRIMMKDSLLFDLSFAVFNEMNNLTQSMSGLYDVHDGRELKEDKSAWNDDYMGKIMAQVVGNFSHERLDHLKDVVRYLRPAASRQRQSSSIDCTDSGQIPPNRPSPSQRNSYQEKRYRNERDRSGGYSRGTKITAGAAGGGVAGGIIAGIAGGSVVIGVVVGAVVVGAVTAVVTKGE